ncbi:MAG: ABC transporter ATP-binding protein [Pseudodonghicola sp.]
MTAITLSGLHKSYGRNAILRDIDLEVEAGEFVVLLGPSGCGKSTLLRMIAGLEEITGGELLLNGRRANDLEPRRRGCAMVFQTYALYPHFTVARNIGYALRIEGVPRAERDRRVREVAAALGLEAYLDRRPAELSGGQRQRVAMGRAMIREPGIFLYDEPLSNLDAKLRVAMRVEIRKLHQRLGATTLFVTHDQVEAMALADRIVVMNGGGVEQVGTPAEVYRRPQTTFVAGFIGTPGLNLIPAMADPRLGVLRLRDGQSVAIAAGRWPDLVPGPVTLGVRAEAIGLAPGGLSARLELAEDLGAGQLLHASLAGDPVVIHHTDGVAQGPGLSLHLAPQDIQLFDAETGQRLAEREVAPAAAPKEFELSD